MHHVIKHSAEMPISPVLGTGHSEHNTILAFSSEGLSPTEATAGGLSQAVTVYKILLPSLESSTAIPGELLRQYLKLNFKWRK